MLRTTLTSLALGLALALVPAHAGAAEPTNMTATWSAPDSVSAGESVHVRVKLAKRCGPRVLVFQEKSGDGEWVRTFRFRTGLQRTFTLSTTAYEPGDLTVRVRASKTHRCEAATSRHTYSVS